jgi:hypothetical protein
MIMCSRQSSRDHYEGRDGQLARVCRGRATRRAGAVPAGCSGLPGRPCLFCGATGASVKITREHTFSNWINKVLTADIIGPDISYERSIMHGPQAGAVKTWPATEAAGHTLKAVCATCNSGWMCGLEDAVRPLIEPMIKGYPASLTTGQQITIATWATMKTAVFENVWTDESVLTTEDRDVIRTQNSPPPASRSAWPPSSPTGTHSVPSGAGTNCALAATRRSA